MMQPFQDIYHSESLAENHIHSMEYWITHADQILTELEQDQALGPTIRRLAFDLATVIGNLAREWEDADDTKKRQWAKSCIEEAKNQLQLQDESTIIHNQDSDTTNNDIATFSQEELIHQVSLAKSLLLDIEDSLRSISADEADEIADVALVVLRIFLHTLKQFYMSIPRRDHRNIHKKSRTTNTTTVSIEIIEESINNAITSPDHIGIITQKEMSSTMMTTATTDTPLSSSSTQGPRKKTRLLWPPLGPTLTQTAIWGKDVAIKQPLLSIALAMTLWPTAIIVGCIGATDHILQSTYNTFQHHPLVDTLEVGAQNLKDIATLYFLCSKLVIQQGIRVGKRQIHRRGGIEKTVQDIGHWTLDRILHPVETIAQGTQVVIHGFGIVHTMIQQRKSHLPKRNTGVMNSDVQYHDCT